MSGPQTPQRFKIELSSRSKTLQDPNFALNPNPTCKKSKLTLLILQQTSLRQVHLFQQPVPMRQLAAEQSKWAGLDSQLVQFPP
ncbi:hypothetical protein B9Z55_008835 [Caenorhabditis nigoni]|uniref:Uncharacterized protein n=1 Tax=Caenorhabditis nigoni TaxID=1611254 RepID=A0A2G5UPB2_9PELO|nr:hypothetical protein B9Z55_008835 [Caenorhabditis nigoni]